MLERPKLQLVIVLLVALGAALSYLFNGINLGTDLKGGTQLIYEVDTHEGAEEKTEAERNDMMEQVVRVIQARLDPDGVQDIVVARRGELGLMIELPGMTKEEAQGIEAKITRLGTLEELIVAYPQYDRGDDVTFDLPGEKARLEAWLKKDDNKSLCLEDLGHIRLFNANAGNPDADGPLSQYIKWYPHKVRVGRDDPTQFETPYSQPAQRFEKSRLSQHVVPVFTPEELQKGPKNDKDWLLEYVPMNMHEELFTGEDLVGSYTRASKDQDGRPVVLYEVKPSQQSRYYECSKRNIGFESAIILDRVVESAPFFRSAIPDRGQISVRTDAQANELAEILKRGSLKVRLEQQSKIQIGATLGARSVRLGGISIAAGASLVLLFILFYYRVSGFVACVGILLNVCLVFGVLAFARATLTLPGLAGLVLTIGMAVDANILIYERIREEIRRGKALLQAVRHGFEKAMVTILDANVTTFLAGLVLYNVGVGPIRGFAVTLMIGIATSVFTAFFVTRLVFHHLLDKDRIKTLPMVAWFSNLRFNFLKYSRVAFAFSLVVIAAGLFVFGYVDNNTKYGMDFTGGATMQIVTKGALTPQDIRRKLKGNDVFHTRFPDPIINTAGDDVQGNRSKEFVVKLKVTAEDAKRIQKERQEAREKGESYQPDYQEQLATALQDVLVSQPLTNAKLLQLDRFWLADITVHYAKPVALAQVQALMERTVGKLDEGQLQPLGTEEAGKHRGFRLQFQVPVSDVQNRADLEKFTLKMLTPKVAKGATTEKADKIAKLSDPIPDVSEIGGRMVGELRNAAIGALILALFLIVMFIRVRFHEYKYGLGAVAALLHDVLVALGIVVFFNWAGLVSCELDLAMIAAFLTIIGYSINDTIVIFDRVRENLKDQERLGDTKMSFADTLNLSINQTLSRTILTSCTTLFVVVAQFVVNKGSGSA
ncbi:MAG: protein translocase subunit SecD, partial [Planctomycetota bacterium]